MGGGGGGVQTMDSFQFNKCIKIFLNRKKIEVFIGFGLAFISPEALANCNQISNGIRSSEAYQPFNA